MFSFDAQAERWGIWECRIQGPRDGNPFTDQTVRAIFTHRNDQKRVRGFYDGDGSYVVRFMPQMEGTWSFEIRCSWQQERLTGSFLAGPAAEGNHGPVHVAGQYHFAYEDGTRYDSIGTTCYVWALQSDEMIAETLETLKHSSFNKIRFCVFPKHYDYNLHEPREYPYEGHPMDGSVLTKENFFQYAGKPNDSEWDLTRFRPSYFRHLEQCIEELGKLGIEADLILFHPYDRWGFSCMTPAQDEAYLQYVIARFAAYRNVWWSLANEYDLLAAKTLVDWERIAAVICREDPYGHLRSIHNCRGMYDHTRPWVTHCSVQRQDLYKGAELVNELRARYGKPVVMDEMAYEGNIQHGWGNITGQEMVRRFWETAMRGGYPGHGETILNDTGFLWWSHGGRLYGESEPRFAFLLKVLRQVPGTGLRLFPECAWDEVCAIPEGGFGGPASFYLYYYSFMRPSFREFHIDDTTAYEVTVLDTWNMTEEKRGVFSGKFRVELPARQYMAVMLKKVQA